MTACLPHFELQPSNNETFWDGRSRALPLPLSWSIESAADSGHSGETSVVLPPTPVSVAPLSSPLPSGPSSTTSSPRSAALAALGPERAAFRSVAPAGALASGSRGRHSSIREGGPATGQEAGAASRASSIAVVPGDGQGHSAAQKPGNTAPAAGASTPPKLAAARRVSPRVTAAADALAAAVAAITSHLGKENGKIGGSSVETAPARNIGTAVASPSAAARTAATGRGGRLTVITGEKQGISSPVTPARPATRNEQLPRTEATAAATFSNDVAESPLPSPSPFEMSLAAAAAANVRSLRRSAEVAASATAAAVTEDFVDSSFPALSMALPSSSPRSALVSDALTLPSPSPSMANKSGLGALFIPSAFSRAMGVNQVRSCTDMLNFNGDLH
jgi:hypothetical protein